MATIILAAARRVPSDYPGRDVSGRQRGSPSRTKFREGLPPTSFLLRSLNRTEVEGEQLVGPDETADVALRLELELVGRLQRDVLAGHGRRLHAGAQRRLVAERSPVELEHVEERVVGAYVRRRREEVVRQEAAVLEHEPADRRLPVAVRPEVSGNVQVDLLPDLAAGTRVALDEGVQGGLRAELGAEQANAKRAARDRVLLDVSVRARRAGAQAEARSRHRRRRYRIERLGKALAHRLFPSCCLPLLHYGALGGQADRSAAKSMGWQR